MIYLDNAATTFPKPESVYEKFNQAMSEYGANPGRSGHKMALEASRDIFHAREELAGLINIDNPLDIIFTFNCTLALNYAIQGVLKEGDHAITTSMEHNSVLRPLHHLSQRGVEVSIVRANERGEINPNDIKKEIKENTKLIIMTHISNLTGNIMPVRDVGRIAKERNIIFLVDSAQSIGVYDIDIKDMNIDLLAFPGHKSLLAPQGTGGLYISDEIELDTIIQGGTGSFSHQVEQPILLPDRYESGTLNAPGLSALGSGVRFIKEQGIDKIRKHEEDLAFRFIDGISRIDNVKIYGTCERGLHAPVVAFNIIDKDSSEVAEILDEKYNIATRPGLHCAPLAHSTIGTDREGAVRASFGFFNTNEEVDIAIDAIERIAKD